MYGQKDINILCLIDKIMLIIMSLFFVIYVF